MPDPKTTPNRVVDQQNYGWYLAGASGGGFRWITGPTNGLASEFADLPALEAIRGPVRPVLPITAADTEALRALFDQAGRKTVTSLAAAIEQVFHQLREAHCKGPWHKDPTGGYDYARRTLMAGRAGSDEASLLMQVQLFGNELNLAKATRQLRDVGDRRAAGPSKRVDKDVRDAIAAILWRWVTDPDRFTELAETLASLVAWYADDRYGPDGWRGIADQWLQPGGLDTVNPANCYWLLYARSDHRNPGRV